MRMTVFTTSTWHSSGNPGPYPSSLLLWLLLCLCWYAGWCSTGILDSIHFFPFFPFLPLRQDYLNGSIFKFANSVFCLFKLILNLSSDCFISITIHFISKISIRFHFIIAFYNYFLFQRYSSGFYEFFFLFMILFSSSNIFKAVGLNYFSSKSNTCVCSVTVSINVFFSPVNRPHFLISLHAFIFFSKTWTFWIL